MAAVQICSTKLDQILQQFEDRENDYAEMTTSSLAQQAMITTSEFSRATTPLITQREFDKLQERCREMEKKFDKKIHELENQIKDLKILLEL